MHESKLLVLLKTIKEENHASLVDFFNSPYFNRNEKLTNLLEHILQFGPDYLSAKLSKEFCYKLLYPERNFEDVKIRRLMSKTLKLLEQFIIHTRVEQDEATQHKLFTDYCIERELETFFKSKVQSWEKFNKGNPVEENLFQSYLINNTKLRLTNTFLVKNMHKNVNNVHEKELKTTIDTLTHFYLYKILNILFVSGINSLMLNTAASEKIDINIITSFFDNKEPALYPSWVQLYYRTFLFFQDSNESNYLALKKQVSEFDVLNVDKQILKDIYKVLEVYVINKQRNNIDGGNQYRELLDLYKYEIEHELVFDDHSFFPLKFRNIVIVALRVQEYEWTEQFIQDYHHTLPPDQLPALHHYCLALLYFHQKKFQEAADLLFNTTDCKDAFFMFDIKRLQIKTYYEQDEIDLLDSMMNAFRVNISRDTFLSENNKLINKHFINMVFRLVGAQSYKDVKKLNKMQEELNSNKAFAERPWLLEKVEEKMMTYAK